MNQPQEPLENSYDVIVVGSGIGGLSAAALLAHAGKRVLVLERHDRPGGYAHSFRRRDYLFDSSVHMTSGCEPTDLVGGAAIHRLLEAVGVRDRCEFLPVDPFYDSVFPGLHLPAPQGIEAFQEALAEHFPKEREGLRRLTEICCQLRDEVARAPEVLALKDPPRMQRELPLLLRYRRATLSDVMDENLEDEKLKAVFGTLWPYLGLPPSKISFLYWSGMLAAFITEGAFYCKGSFQEFANALVYAIERDAGEVRYKSPVQRIVVEDGCVRGVELEDGQCLQAPIVVSNADARLTVKTLIGEDHFSPLYLKRLQEMKCSLSAFVVYLATDLPLHEGPYGHESFFYSSFDHDQHYADTCDGKVSWLSATIPTLLDSSLAPEGEHLMILTTLMAYDIGASWQEEKEQYQNRMLDAVEQYFPGLREHLLFVDSGTPKTMERYTRNSFGSVYGWDVSPDQVGPARLSVDAPIEGLFFAGHWTEPGGGVYGVVLSGLRSAQAALGCGTESELWEQLEKGPSFRSGVEGDER